MKAADSQVVSTPVIEDAVAEDAPLLAELAARTFFEAFAADNDPEDMRRHLEKSYTAELHLAEIRNPAIDTLLMRGDGGAPLAYAQLRAGHVSEGVPAEGSVELWRFYVDRPWHGQGLAHTLMAAAKARARRRGASTLWLGVWERNARAQAFYAKHGFRKVGNHIFVVGSDPQTDDILLCELAQ
ncbi:MAG: GNAT family N-acetyltransferase [Pseudomonadota bacterium]